MRTVAIQIHENRDYSLNLDAVRGSLSTLGFSLITEGTLGDWVEGDGCTTYSIRTPDPIRLWNALSQLFYSNSPDSPNLKDSSIVCCTDKSDSWDDYLLLYHFDPAQTLDELPS